MIPESAFPPIGKTLIALAVLGFMAPLQAGLAVAGSPFFAASPQGMSSPGAQCRAAIAQAEQAAGIPAQLLASIARVESGRRDPNSGAFAPWPWTANAEGQGFFFESKTEAISAIRKLRADGVKSIDVGCLQVNLMHHPNAFSTLEAAFDPVQNAAYAAKFLNDLHTQSGDWPKAAALYHSANPEFGEPYQRKVLAAWPDERLLAGQAPSASFATGSGAARPAFGVDRTIIAPARHNDPAESNPLIASALPAPVNLTAAPGRGLDAYRAAPIAMISRMRRLGG